jgi:hypothetical protein
MSSVVPVSPRKALETGTRLEPLEPPHDTAPGDAAMYVSTGVDSWPTDQPHRLARDVQINDTAYRRLDPEYYAWLRSRMNLARLAAEAGRLRREDFDELRVKFNAVHEWAVAHFGEDALRDAIGQLDARVYSPPVAEVERTVRPKPAEDAGLVEATAKVDSIRERAIELGWTARSLYGAPISPSGARRRDRGLAGYLRSEDQIGEVSRESIEIILFSGIRQRLYNPDVEQPWVRRAEMRAEAQFGLPPSPSSDSSISSATIST